MTYRRDPERPLSSANDDLARRENIANHDAEIARRNAEVGERSVLPAILSVVAIIAVGFLAYYMLAPTAPTTAPRTTEAPRSAPVTPAPTPPATPQTK
jgi:hypothetical protein